VRTLASIIMGKLGQMKVANISESSLERRSAPIGRGHLRREKLWSVVKIGFDKQFAKGSTPKALPLAIARPSELFKRQRRHIRSI